MPAPQPNPTAAAIVFTSVPPTGGAQGQPYVYTVLASAGVAPVTYQLTAGPAGASLAGNTITWIPSPFQARLPNSFIITATGGGAVGTQASIVTPSGVVQGTRIVTHVTDSGDVPVPDDTTLAPIVALIPTGTDYRILVASGSTNGSFAFPSLPPGYYWLQTLYNNDTNSLTEPVATLYSKATSIQLPPSLLASGSSYYFRLSAIYELGVDYETAPFRHTFPRSVAQSLSGVMTP